MAELRNGGIAGPDPASFLSGEPRGIVGRRAQTAALVRDRTLDARLRFGGVRRKLDKLVADVPPRNVRVLSVYRPPAGPLVASMGRLRSRRHGVSYGFGSLGGVVPSLAAETVVADMGGGKFENLNHLIGRGADWVIVVDDDVQLPARFLDRFVGLCEKFDLGLAQPAQSLRSHAAWGVTRRQPGTLLRETRFVEIGPVTAFRRDVAAVLLPFPELRYGWGLDLHWAALAEEHGWKLGVVDALAVRHETGEVGATYSADAAVAEARSFLASRPYVTSDRAQETLRAVPLP